jgi:hypothetical protein
MKGFFAMLMGLPGAVLRFYLPVLRALVASGLVRLLPVALDIVRELAVQNIPGSQKKALAVARLRDVAEDWGVDATTDRTSVV